MSTISESLKSASQTLKTAKIDTPDLDAKLLLIFASKNQLTSAQILAHPEQKISPKIQTTFQNLIQKRAQRIPFAHLTNQQDFFNLPFQISPQTLIPRQDSETLVSWALEICEKTHPQTVAEIGTGSGCLIISLAKNFPNAIFHATDISRSALQTAQKNAKTHKTPIHFHLGDLADPLPPNLDLVISNPPYLTSKDMQNLQPEVQHDPKLALDGGSDGLKFFQKILQALQPKLSPHAQIIFEHASDQAPKISQLAKTIFPNCQIETRSDLTSKPRCTKISLS